MANRTFNAPRALEKELITIAGTFFLNSSAAIVAASSIGRGWSVSKTGTGLYSLLLQDPYQALIAQSVEFGCPNGQNSPVDGELADFNVAPIASVAQVFGVSSAGSIAAQTVNLATCVSTGVKTDTTIAGWLTFILHLRNSSVK